MPVEPAITTGQDLAKLDDRALVLQIAAERLEAASYIAQVRPILEGCR